MEDYLFENIILYNLKGLEVCLSSNSRTKEINYRYIILDKGKTFF